MLQLVQDMMVIVFGLVLILLLLVALRYVHMQSIKMKELQDELTILDKTEDTIVTQQEENDGEKSILR